MGWDESPLLSQTPDESLSKPGLSIGTMESPSLPGESLVEPWISWQGDVVWDRYPLDWYHVPKSPSVLAHL